MREKLVAFREEVQGMCYWWPRSFKHGYCKEANGMDHVCCFCELTEKLDAILASEQPNLLIGVNEAAIRLDELKQLSADYRNRGYREPEMLTARITKFALKPMDTKTFS